MDCHFWDLPLIFHWWVAQKNGKVNFLGLCSSLDNEQLFFSPCCQIGHLFLKCYNDTKNIKFG